LKKKYPVVKVKLSLGSAISLGMRKGRLSTNPTTLYVMLGAQCANNCTFCTQAHESSAGKDRLSRVVWPEFEWDDFFEHLKMSQTVKVGADSENIAENIRTEFKRICFQTLSYPNMVEELARCIGQLSGLGIKTSAAVRPMDENEMAVLRNAGLDRIGISLDGASREIFDAVKGANAGNAYTWDRHLTSLELASRIFPGRTSTHLIIGMGESDENVLDIIKWCSARDIKLALFAFTPFPGIRANFSPPDLARYRTLQAVRWLLLDRGENAGGISTAKGKISGISEMAIIDPDAFRTSGCPSCNRPFYNEKVSGPIFNFPRRVNSDEYAEAINLIRDWLC
jgi:biotin synthase